MKRIIILTAFLGVLNAVFCQKQYIYPSAAQDTTTNTYFGYVVHDPYQWMESGTDPRLVTWLEAEQDFTNKIASRQTHKWDLRAQIVSMYHDVDRDKTKNFAKRNEQFTSKYDFDEVFTDYKKSSDLLFKRRDEKNFRMLIKAKDYIKQKGDKLDYSGKFVSEDEDLAVVTVSVNGSDWNTGYMFNLIDGQRLEPVLPNIKGRNIAWFHKTLYFAAFETPRKGRELLDKAFGQKLYKFEIGKDSIPQLIYTNPDTTGTNSFWFSIHNEKLFIYHFLKSKNTIYKAISCADLNASTFFPRNFLLYPNQDNLNLDIEHTSNDSVWLLTNWDAPNGRVLLANVNNPNKLTEFVPECDMVLEEVNQLGKNKLGLVYLHDGQNSALVYNFRGELLKRIDFPKGKNCLVSTKVMT
jgi:prolyl oligopeptidase